MPGVRGYRQRVLTLFIASEGGGESTYDVEIAHSIIELGADEPILEYGVVIPSTHAATEEIPQGGSAH